MKRWIGLWVVATIAAVLLSGCATTKTTACGKACGVKGGEKKSFTHFGNKMKLASSKTACIKDVLAEPEKFDGKLIRICGQVESVCAVKGCWMRLAYPGSTENLFVKFTCPVTGRLIPMEAVGHQAIVEGTLTVGEITEAEARHYAEDAGKSPQEVATIIGPQKEMWMASPAAMVRGL